MKTSSNPSIKQLVCMYGAALCAILSFACFGVGIGQLVKEPWCFPGIACVAGGLTLIALAVYLYKTYQRLDDEGKPGVKIEDLKNKK